MNDIRLRALTACLAAILAVACGALPRHASPKAGYRYQDLLLDEHFESGKAWRSYDGGADLWLGVAEGVYRIDLLGKRYVWAQHDQLTSDVVIEAESRQLSAYDNNAYGLACRLDPANSGRGYFLLISADGYASIRWSDGRSLQAIVPAFPSQHIHQGAARNRIRAICIGDYLALWVNDEFVAEARDRRTSAGHIGLAGVMNSAGQRLSVEFDDLRVWSAVMDDRGS
ncbi:MAG: hypothetical protein OXE46_04365 [Chloroflexi bacterium]|nr:hypothetical protein [Chloroflexota bacterium]